MNKFATMFAVILALASAQAFADELDKPMSVTTGDLAAIVIDIGLARADLDLTIDFDKSKKKLILTKPFKWSVSLDDAKRTIEKTVLKDVLPPAIERVARKLGITLAEKDFVIRVTSENKVVIAREDGKWVLPD